MIPTTDIWRNEVEAVRRQRALNQIDAAIVHHAAGRELIKRIGAQLLKALIVDDTRCSRCGREHGFPIEGHRYLHGCGIRRALHVLRHRRVGEQTCHQGRRDEQGRELRVRRLNVGIEQCPATVVVQAARIRRPAYFINSTLRRHNAGGEVAAALRPNGG